MCEYSITCLLVAIFAAIVVFPLFFLFVAFQVVKIFINNHESHFDDSGLVASKKVKLCEKKTPIKS